MVWSPLPRTVGSSVIDHGTFVPAGSPGVRSTKPMRVAPSYRFTLEVAGSVVPVTVKSSQLVTSSGWSIVGGQSKFILKVTGSDSEDSTPSIIAVAVMVWSPLPRTVGSSVIDHGTFVPAGSPGVRSTKPMRVAPSYRFTLEVAGSVVPVTVKSSQLVTSSGWSIVGGQSKFILKVTGSDSEDSTPSIIAVAVMVWSPLPRTVGSSVIDHGTFVPAGSPG